MSRYDGRAQAKVALGWSMSLLATFAGFIIGIFFLSFTYHHILWIYLGLSGALYQCIKTHDPDFTIEITFWEYVGIVVAMIGFVVFLYFYTKLKLG